MRLRAVSQSTVAGFIGAAAFAVLTAGTAVAVSTTAVSITNPSTGVRAHVTGKQTLLTSERDPFTGTYAKVDAAGRQLVGEAVPATVWTGHHAALAIGDGSSSENASVSVPASGRLAVRSISVQAALPAGQHFRLHVTYVERNGSVSKVVIPLAPQGRWDDMDYVGATLDTELFPKAGTNLEVWLTRNSATGLVSAEIWFRGQFS